MVADDHAEIVAAVNALRGRYDIVFTWAALARRMTTSPPMRLRRPLACRSPTAPMRWRCWQAHYDRQGWRFNEARQRMARIPDGAALIDNPVSIAPGFTLGNVHVMAGVPQDFRGDGGLGAADADRRRAAAEPILAGDARRGRDCAGLSRALAAEYPDLSMGSYPFTTNGVYGTNLVIRGTDPARVDAAMVRLAAMFGIMTPETLAGGDGGDLARRRLPSVGPWAIRDGAGGGKRVSAATAEGDWHDADLDLAEAAMAALGQDRCS